MSLLISQSYYIYHYNYIYIYRELWRLHSGQVPYLLKYEQAKVTSDPSSSAESSASPVLPSAPTPTTGSSKKGKKGAAASTPPPVKQEDLSSDIADLLAFYTETETEVQFLLHLPYLPLPFFVCIRYTKHHTIYDIYRLRSTWPRVQRPSLS